MMNGESDPAMSRGSATTSSSKSTDLCVSGVLTAAGDADGEHENIDEDADMVFKDAYAANK